MREGKREKSVDERESRERRERQRERVQLTILHSS